MLLGTNFALYIMTSIVAILMPGPAMIYVISNGITRGIGASIVAACGTTVGVAFHVLCTAFGLTLILKTSAIAFTITKFCGAGYLIYLAIKTLTSKEELVNTVDSKKRSGNSIFFQGILINILNPKLSIFFLAFLPQFLTRATASPIVETITLGAIFMSMTVLIFICYGFCASLLKTKVLRNPKVLKVIQRCFGTALLGLGVRLALAER